MAAGAIIIKNILLDVTYIIYLAVDHARRKQ